MKVDKGNRCDFSIFQSMVSILSMRSKYEKLERNIIVLINSVCCSAPSTITNKNDLKSVMKGFKIL